MRSVLACFLILLAGCRDEAAAPASTPDETAAVRACFDGYRAAVLAGDGEAAVARVTASTVAYYDRILHHVLNATADETRELPLMERMNVLLMRARVAPDRLRTMDGRTLFAHAVDIGMIGKDSVQQNELGTVAVSGDRATGEHVYAGRPSVIEWHFRREEGAWRLDLLSILPVATAGFQKVIADANMSEDAFILDVVAGSLGAEPTESIWEPVGR